MAKGDRLLKVIKKASQNANPDTKYTDLLYGVVQSTHPLEVLVDNRLSIDEESLILSPYCFKAAFTLNVDAHSHEVSVDAISQEDHTHASSGMSMKPHKHKLEDKDTSEDGGQEIEGSNTEPGGGFHITPMAHCASAGAHRFTITLWDSLQVGDKLAMLRVAQGQAYLILYKDKLDIKVS